MRLAAWAFLSLVPVGGASAQATRAARVITVGQLVQDTLESRDEVNEYQFRGKRGEELQVLLQGLSGSQTRRVDLELGHLAGDPRLTTVFSLGDDRALEKRSTAAVPVEEDRTFIIRVRSPMTDPVRTPYRFRVVRRNRAPEAVAARVVPGRVVAGERIDLPEDLDEFRVEAREGQQLTVFIQGLSGRRASAVELHVISPAGVRLGAAQSYGDERTLGPRNTGAVRALSTGTFIIRVRGNHDPETPNQYRFRVEIAGEGDG